jgi:hypothetical protein
MPLDPNINYEALGPDTEFDETSVNLRHFFSCKTDEELAEYDPAWTDEQVLEWEEDFRNDGSLMLACSERDVEMDEYRSVLEVHIQNRNLPEAAK